MKKLWLAVLLGLFLFGCGENPFEPTMFKIKYEATAQNATTGYATYIDSSDNIIQTEIAFPWAIEIEVKVNTYVSLSVFSGDDEVLISSKILVDGKIEEEAIVRGAYASALLTHNTHF